MAGNRVNWFVFLPRWILSLTNTVSVPSLRSGSVRFGLADRYMHIANVDANADDDDDDYFTENFVKFIWQRMLLSAPTCIRKRFVKEKSFYVIRK